MKTKALALVLVGLMAQAAAAERVDCEITRSNRYNTNDVATHRVAYTLDVDSWNRRVEGLVESFLLPRSVQVVIDYELLNRRDSVVSLKTTRMDNGQCVATDEEFGRNGDLPVFVENTFSTRGNDYTIRCDLSHQ